MKWLHTTAPHHTRGWFCNVTKVVLTLVRCPPNDSGLTPGEPGHLAREGFCKSQQMHCKYLWQINTKRQPRVSDIRYWRKIKRIFQNIFCIQQVNETLRYDDALFCWRPWLMVDTSDYTAIWRYGPGQWCGDRLPCDIMSNVPDTIISATCSPAPDAAPLWKYLSRFLVQLQIYISFPFSSPAAGRNNEY